MADKKRLKRRQQERENEQSKSLTKDEHAEIQRMMGEFATEQFILSYPAVISFYRANAEEKAKFLVSFDGDLEATKANYAPLMTVVDNWELINFKLIYKALHVRESEALYEQFLEMCEAFRELLIDDLTAFCQQQREQQLKTMSPEDRRGFHQYYLATPQWQRTRRTMLKRAKHKCQVCSSTDRLEVHHNTYARVHMELPSDLIVLCHDCHDIFHKNGKLAKTEDI